MKVNPPDLSIAERVDRACDQFEDDSRGGKRPRIAALAHVPKFPELKQLILGVTGVSDKGLVHLAGLQLTELDFTRTKITDAGLVHLKALASVEQLRIVDTEISDAGIEHLLALNGLKRLSIWNTKITEEGLNRLHEGLPGCRIDAQPR